MRQSRNFILVETALRGGCARNVTVRSRHVTQMGLSQTQLVILYLEHEDERSHPLIPHLPSLDNRSDADGAFSAGDQRAAAAERRAAGDHVTVEVSRCDAHRVTPGDFCARYGASTALVSEASFYVTPGTPSKEHMIQTRFTLSSRTLIFFRVCLEFFSSGRCRTSG